MQYTLMDAGTACFGLQRLFPFTAFAQVSKGKMPSRLPYERFGRIKIEIYKKAKMA